MTKRALVKFLVGFLVLAASAAYGAELSADMVMNSMGHTITSKIFMKDKLIRTESPQGVVTIFRGDKNVVWMLNTKDKTYWETKAEGDRTPVTRNPAEMEAQMLKMGTRKKIGTEKVNGYECDKYLFIFHNKSLGTQTQWISKKLKIMIKAVSKNQNGTTTTIEWKNIKVGKQPMSLFEIPKGYKKSQGPPGMPPGLNKKGGMPPGIGKRMHPSGAPPRKP